MTSSMNTNISSYNWHDPANARNWIENKMRSGNQTRPEQIEILLELLAVLQADGQRVLDLGCGDGAIAEMVLTRFPSAYVVGLDSSSLMLEAARARLSRFAGRFTLLAHDLRETHAALFDVGTFDALIGVQAVHHLTSEEKRDLFNWAALLLRDGGIFLLADRIKLDMPALFPYYLRLWDRLQLKAGAPPSSAGYAYADHLAGCDRRGDKPDTIEDQLDWMKEAGLGAVGVFYRYVERAVFGGLKLPQSYLPPLPAIDLNRDSLRGL